MIKAPFHQNLKISNKSALVIQDEHLDLPDPLKDEHIIAYYKRKKSGTYDDADYYIWERQFMDKMATCEFVHKNQSRLIMDLDFYQFAELIDIKPTRGSHFIHSMSEPFSEEDIEDEVLHNWLDHFGMQFHQLHASGHMDKKQLEEFIKHIKPKHVFPIHTENQHLFKEKHKNVQMVKYGKQYIL